jgi:hypothetical protein
MFDLRLEPGVLLLAQFQLEVNDILLLAQVGNHRT